MWVGGGGWAGLQGKGRQEQSEGESKARIALHAVVMTYTAMLSQTPTVRNASGVAVVEHFLLTILP